MAQKILVSKQKLAKYSTSRRAKLTLAQHVEAKIGMLFPPELRDARKAQLIMFLDGHNEGGLPFVVTASLQKLGEKRNGDGVVQSRDRVVLLESDWMPIVRALQLQKGDTVSLFLLNDTAWTYLIAVERAPDEADRIDEVDAMDEDVVVEEAPMRMEFDLNEPVQLEMEFDLNEPVQLDMENNLNQPNQPIRMDFDLNEPVQPHSDINLNDED